MQFDDFLKKRKANESKVDYDRKMGRPKGMPKTGGRKKGTPNQRSLELLTVFEAFKYNPARAILERYSHLSKEEQVRVDLKLMEFVYARKKAIDIEPKEESQDYISSMTPEQVRAERTRIQEYLWKKSPDQAREALLMIRRLHPHLFDSLK
jgi:hypothetical protein